MQLLKASDVKGSSIAETVVAMAVIAICMSMAMIIYVRVLDTEKNVAYYKSEQKVKELYWETESKKDFLDEDFDFNIFKIKKKVVELKDDELYKVTFTTFINKQKKEYSYIVAN